MSVVCALLGQPDFTDRVSIVFNLVSLCLHLPLQLSCVFSLDDASLRPPPETLHGETRDLWPAVTINSPTRGNFGGQDYVAQNNIFELCGTEPGFLTEFKDKLRKPRWIDSNTVCFFNHIPLVIENYRRTLSLSGMSLADLTTTLKTNPLTSRKKTKTVSPVNDICIILKARFYATVGRQTPRSKRPTSVGSLTSWGCTSRTFLV